jgi:hypothetical protein
MTNAGEGSIKERICYEWDGIFRFKGENEE